MEGGLLLFDCCNECIIDKTTTKVSKLLNHIVGFKVVESYSENSYTRAFCLRI